MPSEREGRIGVHTPANPWNRGFLSIRWPSTTAQALDLFGERVDAFEASYRWALEAILELGRPTTVCTIYNGNLDGNEAGRTRIALMMFNDVIHRVALVHSVNTLDLRLVCTEKSDFANPIEPSGSGGRKIARAIAAALGASEAPLRRSLSTAG